MPIHDLYDEKSNAFWFELHTTRAKNYDILEITWFEQRLLYKKSISLYPCTFPNPSVIAKWAPCVNGSTWFYYNNTTGEREDIHYKTEVNPFHSNENWEPVLLRSIYRLWTSKYIGWL